MDNRSRDIKKGRLASTITRIAAQFLSEEANREPLITIVDCILSSDQRHATLLVSVIPESKSAVALIYLKRKRGDVRVFAKKHLKGMIPFFDFKLVGGKV